MSPKSCLGCTKCFVFLLNLFFFFLGILLLAFSFWVLFDRQSFAAVLGSPLVSLRVWSYGFSGVGIVTMFLGFLGCLGALKEVKVMLGLYFGLLLLLFAAQITVAVIIYTQRAALATKVATYTEELIRGYPTQGPPGDPHESWDAVQQQGCKERVQTWLAGNLVTIVGVCIGIGLGELSLLMLSMFLVQNLDSRYEKLLRGF
ncbi:leukocyte antigen CD37-like isoform X4 [Hirundo rustica]|uniref:leukocyte antigen CD37-like isoform X4 n=1 Tax=Hirundo rustica TaxID=43150 RepID=UPI001A93AA48|nr:leukocyte antigen CD37-like isoform X4 [Hirundo rustica]